jgi:hypothetical protein
VRRSPTEANTPPRGPVFSRPECALVAATPAFRTLLDVRVTAPDYGERDTLPKLKVDGSSDPRLLPLTRWPAAHPSNHSIGGDPGGRIHA